MVVVESLDGFRGGGKAEEGVGIRGGDLYKVRLCNTLIGKCHPEHTPG